MTKDVLISISGLHFGTEEENGEGEPVEIITPAVYYLKNDRHYVLYDEVVEGVPGTVKNTIKINGDSLFELRKSGLANARMVFEKGRMNMTSYQTPFGEMMVGDPHEGHHHRSRRGQNRCAYQLRSGYQQRAPV